MNTYIFIQNKYTKWHWSIINRTKNEKRVKLEEPKFEEHHIIAKCLGGDNSPQNLVLLTYKEHYIVHLLLIKMTNGKDRGKIAYAFSKMRQDNTGKRYKSKSYAIHRKIYMKYMGGENHPMYGKHHSEKTRKQQRESRLKYFENNPQVKDEQSKKMIEHYKNNPEAGSEHSKTMIKYHKNNTKKLIYLFGVDNSSAQRCSLKGKIFDTIKDAKAHFNMTYPFVMKDPTFIRL